MTSNTHPDPFPTLPPPHACMVNLNHTKKIPSILRGICTLFQLYQCRLSVDCRTARAKCAVWDETPESFQKPRGVVTTKTVPRSTLGHDVNACVAWRQGPGRIAEQRLLTL